MITRHGAYWHLYFSEECEDTPTAILELVEKLFKEINEMGDMAYFRVYPIIQREKTFEGGVRVTVRCRISTPPPCSPDPDPTFVYLREASNASS